MFFDKKLITINFLYVTKGKNTLMCKIDVLILYDFNDLNRLLTA